MRRRRQRSESRPRLPRSAVTESRLSAPGDRRLRSNFSLKTASVGGVFFGSTPRRRDNSRSVTLITALQPVHRPVASEHGVNDRHMWNIGAECVGGTVLIALNPIIEREESRRHSMKTTGSAIQLDKIYAYDGWEAVTHLPRLFGLMITGSRIRTSAPIDPNHGLIIGAIAKCYWMPGVSRRIVTIAGTGRAIAGTCRGATIPGPLPHALLHKVTRCCVATEAPCRV